MSANKFDYFDPYHSQQYQFVPVPMALLSDDRFKDLSNEAKILYSLMLNRVGLSKENNWLDENGRVYIIYTVEQAAAILRKGRDTAMKAMAELDMKKGIGLIERVKQGRGKPDRIYVKDFFIKQEVEESVPVDEVGETDRKKSKKATSGDRKNRPQKVGKTDPSKNNINNTDLKNTDLIYPSPGRISRADILMDGMDEIHLYTDKVRKNIDYDILAKSLEKIEMDLVNEIVTEVVEVLCSRQEVMKIGEGKYPMALVKKRMLDLRFEHIQYILECLKNAGRGKEIENIKAYRLKTIFNAPSTIGTYYQAKANYDMCAGGFG